MTVGCQVTLRAFNFQDRLYESPIEAQLMLVYDRSGLCTACPLPLHCLSAAFALLVRCLCTAHPLPLRCLSAAFVLLVSCICTAAFAPLPLHRCLCTALPLPLHCSVTAFPCSATACQCSLTAFPCSEQFRSVIFQYLTVHFHCHPLIFPLSFTGTHGYRHSAFQ